MADYPTSVPSFIDLVDNQDDVLAEHQNTPNDEITAISTMIGALGGAQSKSIDLLSALLNAEPPDVRKKTDSSIEISAPTTVWLGNAAQSQRYARRITSAITLTSADLDTGSMAVGWYAVYADGDAVSTTYAGKISASFSSPTGVTNYELLGWFYNETGGALDVTSGFVSNVRRGNRRVQNVAYLIGTTNDTINDTSYGSDLTETTVRFYVPKETVVEIGFVAKGVGMGPTLNFIVDIDGSDQSASEVESNLQSSDLCHINCRWISRLAAGTHTITIQAQVPSGGSAEITNKQTVVKEL